MGQAHEGHEYLRFPPSPSSALLTLGDSPLPLHAIRIKQAGRCPAIANRSDELAIGAMIVLVACQCGLVAVGTLDHLDVVVQPLGTKIGHVQVV